jgi:predicted DCC family thiol-disulfide oxidoreductase YuxK
MCMQPVVITSATEAYSYRRDPAVPAFDDSHALIIFDGFCALCSVGVQFMLKHDPHGTSRFAAIQDPVPRALYLHYGLNPQTFDTFMVLKDGVPHTRWRGVLAAGETMGAFWKVLATLGRLIPDAIGNPVYDLVQQKRIGWFGARQSCFLPDDQQKARFLQS